MRGSGTMRVATLVTDVLRIGCRGLAYPSLGIGAAQRARYPRGVACAEPVYRPRDTEHTVLHQVIGEHLEAFLRAAAEAGEGVGLPRFVEREFRELLMCGVFEHGFARFRCEGCARAHSVPFPRCLQIDTMRSLAPRVFQ